MDTANLPALGVDLDDLDLDLPEAPVSSSTPAVDREPQGLEQDSTLARVVFECWSGTPVTVVASPPGAGKTRLVTKAGAMLYDRAKLNIVVATITRRGAIDLANRIAAKVERDDDVYRVSLGLTGLGEDELDRIDTLRVHCKTGEKNPAKAPVPGQTLGGAHVAFITVRTVASCAASPPECDLMIVDEAYQLTFSSAASAAAKATQVLLVGDPGQIGPVVTTDTQVWSGREAGPHRRAPEVFAGDPQATTLSLPSTYRLGARTAEVIAPLYDFAFDSQRPDRHLIGPDGAPLPEIRSHLVTATSETDLGLLTFVARLAASFVGLDVVEDTDDGPQTRALTASDVAVVVARNAQDTAVRALLANIDPDLAVVTVGTADRLQGGQWHAVVAVDPLTGSASLDGFRTGPGRLCVMASRHMTHLAWVHDGTWAATLATVTGDDTQDAARGLAVRRELTR